MRTKNRITWKTPAGFDAYFKARPSGASFSTPQAERLKEISTQLETLKTSAPQLYDIVHAEHLAAIANFVQPTVKRLPGIGFTQAQEIGSMLIPDFVGGADEKASYPIGGNEAFVLGDSSKVGPQGKVKTVDIAMEWAPVTTDVYAYDAIINTREQAAAGGVGIDAIAYKADVLRKKLALEKEQAIATLLLATGSYGSASNYNALSGTTAWNKSGGKAVTDLVTARDAVRKYARTLENAVAWFGPQAWLDFTLNAEVRTLVQYTSGANPSNFAIKATIQPDLISAILGIPVVIGNMGKATSAATDPTTDVWTDSAGIVLTGGNDAFGMRFALNVMAQGYPATTQWFDEDYGAKGANKVKQADSWKLTVVKNTAAYLISDTNQ